MTFFNMHSPKFFAALIPTFIIPILLIAGGTAHAQSSCISFESPLSGDILSETNNTVSLKVDCANVIKVDLRIAYFPQGSSSPVFLPDTMRINRPPYMWSWRTDSLPNQLYTGVAIVAEAFMSDATIARAQQEGIFLTHNKTAREKIPVPYARKVDSNNPEDWASMRSFKMDNDEIDARSLIVWNENGLTVHAVVHDKTFNKGNDSKKIDLEILIDPYRKKAPHPGNPDDNVMSFIVPLSGAPYKVSYRADINRDGTSGKLKLVPQSERINYDFRVDGSEFNWYSIQLTIPKGAFGKTLPDTIGANVILKKTRDDNGSDILWRVALTGDNDLEIRSPFTWCDYYMAPKPLHMYAGIQWGVSFIAGFLLSIIIYLIIAKLRKPQHLQNFERSEEEKSIFDRMNIIIEQELVNKNLSLEYVAGKSGLSPQELNSLVKRNTGFNFMNYLQYCRTEVAKERLRSSRSSEKNIADLCGFASAIEMEKCFVKYHHTTPYKFRLQQQVS